MPVRHYLINILSNQLPLVISLHGCRLFENVFLDSRDGHQFLFTRWNGHQLTVYGVLKADWQTARHNNIRWRRLDSQHAPHPVTARTLRIDPKIRPFNVIASGRFDLKLHV
jgi:hypothetical protein